MRRAIDLVVVGAVLLFAATGVDSLLCAADGKLYPFEVCETAGIRRRNDVVTIETEEAAIVGHTGGFRVVSNDKQVPAQIRRVEWPGDPQILVLDFIDHFQPLESRRYSLELLDGPTPEEPTGGLTLTETADAYRIDSGGVVSWTIRKDLAGLLDFSWKDTDYIADGSNGLYFQDSGGLHNLSDRLPKRVVVERSGPIAVGLLFEYEDRPPGARSTVHLEFPRTKSWIHATWTIDGVVEQVHHFGAVLNLRLDGPEAMLDFGAGDFVYCTVTKEQNASFNAGPRLGPTVPWEIAHASREEGGFQPLVTAPKDIPTLRVPGWAHVMDDKRCTALAVADFGETASDSIRVSGEGRLGWSRSEFDDRRAGTRQLEFWLHFVTMPVHIGARTSPRSMQEPLEVEWLSE